MVVANYDGNCVKVGTIGCELPKPDEEVDREARIFTLNAPHT